MHSHPPDPWPETGPASVTRELTGPDGVAFQRGGDARAFFDDPVLDIIDVADELGARRERFDDILLPVDSQQRDPGTIGAGHCPGR